MDLQAFLDYLNSGKPVQGGGQVHQYMHLVSQEALQITAEINGSYHTPEELRALFSRLDRQTGGRGLRAVSALPHRLRQKHSPWGKTCLSTWAVNSRIRGAFIIGDGALIGHNVVLATLNHAKSPGIGAP